MEQKRIPVTREGLDTIKKELEWRKGPRAKEITASVAEARSHGDLRENAAYDAAREDQMMNQRRIAEIERQLRQVYIVDEGAAADNSFVSVGSVVVVDFDGDEESYTIVGAIEAKPTQGKISNESPIGQALMGKRVGEHAKVPVPGGMSEVTIKAISR